MPRHSIDIFVEVSITQRIDSAAPEIVVVVEEPYLGIERGAGKCRPKMLRHKLDLILLPPQRLRHSTVLVRVGFILHGYGVDLYSCLRVALQILDEVLGVSREVMVAHTAAQKGFAALHPSGRAPGRSKQKQFWIYLGSLFQCRKNVCPVMVDAEVREFRVRFRRVVITVSSQGVIA